MNTDIVKGKWNDIKGEIQTEWGKLTGDDLDQTKGNLHSIAGLIQQHYGETKQTVMEKLGKYFGASESKVNETKDSAASWAAEKTEKAKDSLRNIAPPPSRL